MLRVGLVAFHRVLAILTHHLAVTDSPSPSPAAYERSLLL